MAQDDLIRDWDDLLELHRRHHKFEPGAYFDLETDMLHVALVDEQGEDSPFDGRLYVAHSPRTGSVTHFTLYSVRERLLPVVRSLGLDQGQRQLTVGMFLFAELISLADQEREPALGGFEALQTLAELCRVAGRTRVEMDGGFTPLTPPATA